MCQVIQSDSTTDWPPIVGGHLSNLLKAVTTTNSKKRSPAELPDAFVRIYLFIYLFVYLFIYVAFNQCRVFLNEVQYPTKKTWGMYYIYICLIAIFTFLGLLIFEGCLQWFPPFSLFGVKFSVRAFDVFNISERWLGTVMFPRLLDHPLPTYGLEFGLCFLNGWRPLECWTPV